MPQLVRHYCSRCGISVYNCTINKQRVPIVFTMAVDQPIDTGPTLSIDDPDVPLPGFIRAIMSTPTKRVELCINCVAEVFGQPILTAKTDPNAGMAGLKMRDLVNKVSGLERTKQEQAITAHVYDALGHSRKLKKL